MASKIRFSLFTRVRNDRGFSLLEMIIAMSLFMVIMLITTNAFNKMITMASSLLKSAESNIEGVVGLEMVRKDVAQAGYGLPWTVQQPYSSARSMLPATLAVTAAQIQSLNDEPLGAPRAVGSLDNLGYNGSDYLAVKSTVIAMNAATKKSAIIRQDGIIPTDPSSAGRFKGTDTVVVLRPVFSSAGVLTNKLLIGKGTYTNVSTATSTFRPDNLNDTYIAYGLDNSTMRTPFNRGDFFIHRPTDDKAVPDVCAKIDNPAIKATTGIGILYKAVMHQAADGSFTMYPLLDCVLDMQVVYGVDESTTQDGSINNHYSVLPVSYDAATIRSQLKEVRIHILAQDGNKDRTYTYPDSTIYVGETPNGRLFDLSASNIKDWQNYRWKIYTLVVRLSL